MYRVQVVDWGDDAYKEYGTSHIIAEFVVEKYTGVCYDGGRLEFDHYPEVVWVNGHQWSVNVYETDLKD